ncbi:ankyrin repeat domain-containing protein 26 [Tupaia chinensis]|uniref:ankyrin repeat domain-containing protein 26 n=1 Tax=Tupaia chinensis TaxID=246437 RepID=UPI000FFB842D|nr:ankyrin repeat domain-containing protein 26 [Tupaia chinensis]
MRRIFGLGGKQGRGSGAKQSVRQSVHPLSEYIVKEGHLHKIHKAVLAGDLEQVQEILNRKENVVNQPDKKQRTALHLACASGHEEMVTLLAERQCELDLRDGQFKTPLIMAVQCQHEKCANILLEYGADPIAHDSSGNTALHYAAHHGMISIAQKLLSLYVNIDARSKAKMTPLLNAISADKPEMVDFLIKKKANVYAVDAMQRTALMFAAKHRSTYLVERFLNLGVNPCLKDDSGYTAETYAQFSGFNTNCELLSKSVEKYKSEMSQSNHEVHKGSGDSIKSISKKPKSDDSQPTSGGDILGPDTKEGARIPTSAGKGNGIVIEQEQIKKDDLTGDRVSKIDEQSASSKFGTGDEETESSGESESISGSTSFTCDSSSSGAVDQKGTNKARGQQEELDLKKTQEEEQERVYGSAKKQSKVAEEKEHKRNEMETSKNLHHGAAVLPGDQGDGVTPESAKADNQQLPAKKEGRDSVKGTKKKKNEKWAWTNDRDRRVLEADSPSDGRPCGNVNSSHEIHPERVSTNFTLSVKDTKKNKNEKWAWTNCGDMQVLETDDSLSEGRPDVNIVNSSHEVNPERAFLLGFFPSSDSTLSVKDTKKDENEEWSSTKCRVIGMLQADPNSAGRPCVNAVSRSREINPEGVSSDSTLSVKDTRKDENEEWSSTKCRVIRVLQADPNSAGRPCVNAVSRSREVNPEGVSSDSTLSVKDTRKDENEEWSSTKCRVIRVLQADPNSAGRPCVNAVSRSREVNPEGVRSSTLHVKDIKKNKNEKCTSKNYSVIGVLETDSPPDGPPCVNANNSLRERNLEEERKQLKGKEDQYGRGVEMKQPLELNLRTLDVELKSARNNLNPVEEEQENTKRQLSLEQNMRIIKEKVLASHLCKQKELEMTEKKINSQVSDSCEIVKYLWGKNHRLQNEIAELRVEIDRIQNQNQEKEKKYVEDIQILKEKTRALQKTIKQNEATLSKTISQYSGELNVLTTQNTELNSELENEKQNKERLEAEVESYHSRLAAAIHDRDENQKSKRELELDFQRTRDEWSRLQDKMYLDVSNLKEENESLSQQLSETESKLTSLKIELQHTREETLREKTLALEQVERNLSQIQGQVKETELKYQNKMNKLMGKMKSLEEKSCRLQSENMSLRQQLENAQNEADAKAKTVDMQDQLCDIVKNLQVQSEKQNLMTSERNKELVAECNHLKDRLRQYENERAERDELVVVIQLQQQLTDALKKQSMLEASLELTSRDHINSEDKIQDLKEKLSQMRSQLQEAQKRQAEAVKSAEEMQDPMQKLEGENFELKVTFKKQAKTENLQENQAKDENEQLEKLTKLKQSLEYNLDQEIKKNGELEKERTGLKKLLEMTRKKLNEYENREISFQGDLKPSQSEMGIQVNMQEHQVYF